MSGLKCIPPNSNILINSSRKRLRSENYSVQNDIVAHQPSKRQRNSFCYSTNVEIVPEVLGDRRMKKLKVLFDTSKNVEYSRYYSDDDLKEAWLQRGDYISIHGSFISVVNHHFRERQMNERACRNKLSIMERFLRSSSEDCIDVSVFNDTGSCMRGLENHASQEIMKEKKRQKTLHTELVVKKYQTLLYMFPQQSLLPQNYEDGTNAAAATSDIVDTLLCLFASELSSIDTDVAIQLAKQDAFDAAIIHFMGMKEEQIQ